MSDIPHPKTEKVNILMLRIQRLVDWALKILLTISVTQILVFYIWSMFKFDIVEIMTFKYAVYVAAACFVCLFVNNKEIDTRFGARDVPVFEEKNANLEVQISQPVIQEKASPK